MFGSFWLEVFIQRHATVVAPLLDFSKDPHEGTTPEPWQLPAAPRQIFSHVYIDTCIYIYICICNDYLKYVCIYIYINTLHMRMAR